MKYTIRYSIFARADVSEIKQYLSQFYPGTPQKFVSQLKEGVAMLKTTPKMFEVYETNPLYRKMVVQSYVVFYRVEEKEKTVFIYRVLHGKQDGERHL